MTVSFEVWAQARRQEVERALEAAVPASPPCPAVVSEAMRYCLGRGTKRVRPVLVMAAAEAVAKRGGAQGDDAALEAARQLAMPAACAIEFIHTYSLVHDDLPSMDNDALRRGKPTLHVVYGETLAILASDGLLAEGFSMLAHQSGDRSQPGLALRTLQVLREVGRAVGAAGMLGGQASDRQFAGRITHPAHPVGTATPEALRDMHLRKTGALIRAAAVAGGVMVGAQPADVAALEQFGEQIGLAFQIVDDILDEIGTSGELGKTAGKDRAEGKPTYPALFGLEQSKALARAHVDAAGEALAGAGLPDEHLLGIARWVVDRRRMEGS
ncbi:MAG: polyprenyl synthetase family protein [Acidimicrobiia bacterium]